jgi:hypothetical protein
LVNGRANGQRRSRREAAQNIGFAEVAQLVEQPIRNRQVIGSIPILGSI